MRSLTIPAAILAVALVTSGFDGRPEPSWRPFDPGLGYERVQSATPAPIPDNDADGILLGPLRLGPGAGAFVDLILEIEAFHPSPGDLQARLCYDENLDGRFEVDVLVPLYLARTAPDDPPTWGCPLRLDGAYFFRVDRECDALHDWEETSFSDFLGCHGGGDFFLRLVDERAQDVGFVKAWAVSVRCRRPLKILPFGETMLSLGT